MARSIVEQQVRVVVEATNHTASCGHIGEQKTPRDGRAKPRGEGSSKHSCRANRVRLNAWRNGLCTTPRVTQLSSPAHTRATCHCRQARRAAGWWLRVWWWEPSWRPTAPGSPSGIRSRPANHNSLSLNFCLRCAPCRRAPLNPRLGWDCTSLAVWQFPKRSRFARVVLSFQRLTMLHGTRPLMRESRIT